MSDFCRKPGFGDWLPKSSVPVNGGSPAVMRPLFSWCGSHCWVRGLAGAVNLDEYLWKVLLLLVFIVDYHRTSCAAGRSWNIYLFSV